mgnify:CR=1 FL=1
MLYCNKLTELRAKANKYIVLRGAGKWQYPMCAEITKKERSIMKHVKTLNTKRLQNTIKKGGCGECQTSCQSACKTSCTVGNQSCENSNR